jgi:hypothetical protein
MGTRTGTKEATMNATWDEHKVWGKAVNKDWNMDHNNDSDK